MTWKEHVIRLGGTERQFDAPPDPSAVAADTQAWLSALVQAEHVALLTGNGLTTAVGMAAECSVPQMNAVALSGDLEPEVSERATGIANVTGRTSPNVEDQLRAALELIGGLRILKDDRAATWQDRVDETLRGLMDSVLACERELAEKLATTSEAGARAAKLLVSFLASFAGRPPTRERAHVFTTNYDRLIEFGCDLAGLRPLDRFIGTLSPIFRASRLDVDLHYNPPGLRGEPRFLDGVLKLTKLHGSLDWRAATGLIRRVGLPFGAASDHPEIPDEPSRSLLIYPNPAKEVETLDLPYSELFRDLSAAVCRPNSVLISYGYGFGDEHINRVIRDMLSISSTHLLAISYDDCGGLLPGVLEEIGTPNQVSFMVGSHFGDLQSLVAHYLPRPSVEVKPEVSGRHDFWGTS